MLQFLLVRTAYIVPVSLGCVLASHLVAETGAGQGGYQYVKLKGRSVARWKTFNSKAPKGTSPRVPLSLIQSLRGTRPTPAALLPIKLTTRNDVFPRGAADLSSAKAWLDLTHANSVGSDDAFEPTAVMGETGQPGKVRITLKAKSGESYLISYTVAFFDGTSKTFTISAGFEGDPGFESVKRTVSPKDTWLPVFVSYEVLEDGLHTLELSGSAYYGFRSVEIFQVF